VKEIMNGWTNKMDMRGGREGDRDLKVYITKEFLLNLLN
jgi:hypothetical protein